MGIKEVLYLKSGNLNVGGSKIKFKKTAIKQNFEQKQLVGYGVFLFRPHFQFKVLTWEDDSTFEESVRHKRKCSKRNDCSK